MNLLLLPKSDLKKLDAIILKKEGDDILQPHDRSMIETSSCLFSCANSCRGECSGSCSGDCAGSCSGDCGGDCAGSCRGGLMGHIS